MSTPGGVSTVWARGTLRPLVILSVRCANWECRGRADRAVAALWGGSGFLGRSFSNVRAQCGRGLPLVMAPPASRPATVTVPPPLVVVPDHMHAHVCIAAVWWSWSRSWEGASCSLPILRALAVGTLIVCPTPPHTLPGLPSNPQPPLTPRSRPHPRPMQMTVAVGGRLSRRLTF